jgi:peptide/nickel transport system substrate-binding protein
MKKIIFLFAVLAMTTLAVQPPAFAERSGGTLNFMAPYGGSLSSLNPYITSRYQDYLVSMNIHRSLYRWDADKSIPVLDLAESVTVSDDGLTYTYKLWPNIKFHNGRQLISDDVIWSYTYISAMQPASPSFQYIQPVKGAMAVNKGEADTVSGLKKIDDLTFEITLENPLHPMFYGWRQLWPFCPKKNWLAKKTISKTIPLDAVLSSSQNGSKDPRSSWKNLMIFSWKENPTWTRLYTRSCPKPPPGTLPSRQKNWMPPLSVR